MADKEIDVFKGIFGHELKRVKYKGHPSNQVLQRYLRGELRDERRFSEQILKGLITGELEEWMLPEVAAHVMTCERCSKTVAWLKWVEKVRVPMERSEQVIQEKIDSVLESPRFSGRRAFYRHVGGYVAVGASLAFLFFIYQQSPSLVLQSAGGEAAGSLLFKILLGLASAWGGWGITGLALHGYKAFRRGE